MFHVKHFYKTTDSRLVNPTVRCLDVGVKEKDMDIYRIYTALPE